MIAISYNLRVQKVPIFPVLLRIVLLGLIITALNLSTYPHSDQREWSRARSTLEDGLPGQAAISFHHIASTYPWREDLRWAAARYALMAGDWLHGIQWMGLVDPDRLSSEDILLLGDAYQARGDLYKAEKIWQQALSEELSQPTLERLYTLHLAQNDIPAVTQDLRRLVSLEPNNQEQSIQFALYLAASDPQASMDWLEKASVTKKDLKNQAERFSQKLKLALRENLPEVQLLRAGQALAEFQEWNLAKAAFENALAINADYAEAWSFLGETRQHLEPPEPQTALLNLRQGLNLNPNSVAVLSMLALYWQRQNDLSRAADLYRSTANLDPDNPTWPAALGGIANADGDLHKAEWYYQSAVQLAPRDPVYWRMLANFYILNQIQIREKALDAAQKAYDLNPKDPGSLDTLGQTLLLLEERQEALKLFAQAIEIDPTFAPAHLHFGFANLFNGNAEQAYRHLTLARDLADDEATADQAERLLRYYFP